MRNRRGRSRDARAAILQILPFTAIRPIFKKQQEVDPEM
jgi:hypothetical protein